MFTRKLQKTIVDWFGTKFKPFTDCVQILHLQIYAQRNSYQTLHKFAANKMQTTPHFTLWDFIQHTKGSFMKF